MQIAPDDAEPFGAQFELSARFLARYVEDFSRDPVRVRRSESVRNLHKKRRFSYARFARKEDDRPAYKSAAENAVKLAESRLGSNVFGEFKLVEFLRVRGVFAADAVHRNYALRCGCFCLRLHNVLDKRVPRAAGRAFSEPLRTFVLTFGAYIYCFKTFHSDTTQFIQMYLLYHAEPHFSTDKRKRRKNHIISA